MRARYVVTSSMMPSASMSMREPAADIAQRQHRHLAARLPHRRGRRRGTRGGLALGDGADELKAAAMQGANQPLRLAVVAERLAGSLDATRQRGVRDGAALPDCLENLVLGDEPVALTDKKHKQIEYLRLHGDGLDAAADGKLARVDCVGTNLKQHSTDHTLTGRARSVRHVTQVRRFSRISSGSLQAFGRAWV